MRNDVNASNEDSRREIILNVRIKCLLQVTILELVKIEMNDILDVMFFTKIVLQEHYKIKDIALFHPNSKKTLFLLDPRIHPSHHCQFDICQTV